MPENLTQRLGLSIPAWGWLTEPMQPDVKTQIKRLARAPDLTSLAVMPDVHLARDVCIGVAFSTRTLLYPQAVGGDIGCGMMAVRVHGEGLASRSRGVLECLQHSVPVLRQPQRDTSAAEMPDPASLSNHFLRRQAERDGMLELGTLGRGNHFLELQECAEGSLWLVVHSGSRCMGQIVKDHHMHMARRVSGGLFSLDARTPQGLAYLNDAEWCVRYAEANRRAMLEAAAAALASRFGVVVESSSFFGTPHNFVRQEAIGDDLLYVHRKGASHAGSGVRSIIPGSMGTATYFTQGKGCPTSLASSSHGAGRTRSRTEARSSISRQDLVRQLGGVYLDPGLLRALVDEAPGAYKDIARVMRAQTELVRIDRSLRALVSHKGT